MGGLNLDRNPGKKKSLFDFLLCLPEMLEKVMTKDHLRVPFVEAGMTDKETRSFPHFDELIGTCKRWVSNLLDIGVSLAIKQHCKDQFQRLAEIQQALGQVSWAAMAAVDIPRG